MTGATEMHAATFAEIFAAWYAGHMVADHWLQTRVQALGKGAAGRAGRLADLRHVLTMTGTKLVTLALAWAVVGVSVTVWVIPAMAVDAASHYLVDRREPLFAMARGLDRLYSGFGKAEFAQLGSPRPGRDDNPTLGTGAYALDQSWHVLWLFIAALIAAR